MRYDVQTLLFFDELHTLVDAGGADGAMNASNILNPCLARGELQIVGATTIDEYRKHIEKDAALERRFQPVMVEEPSEDETVAILKGLRHVYEEHHRVKITDAALEAAVKLSSRYINDRFLPDKAIDLVDEAASKVRLTAFVAPEAVSKLKKDIESLNQEKESAALIAEFFKDSNLPQDFTDRISFLVSHHHTLDQIDGIDYQIIIEADHLVNADESHFSGHNIKNMYDKIFKTETGKFLLRSMYQNCLENETLLFSEYRNGGFNMKEYDIIIGNVADDDVFKTVDMYFRGLWNKEKVLNELRYYKMNNQICIVKQEALDCLLTFQKAYEVNSNGK